MVLRVRLATDQCTGQRGIVLLLGGEGRGGEGRGGEGRGGEGRGGEGRGGEGRGEERRGEEREEGRGGERRGGKYGLLRQHGCSMAMLESSLMLIGVGLLHPISPPQLLLLTEHGCHGN